MGVGCSRSGGGEVTGQGARIRGWGRRDAYSEVLGCRNGGEGARRRSKRRKRKRRKKGKGEAASPPRGRGRRNRSPTNWRMRHRSCNDKHVNVSWGTELVNRLDAVKAGQLIDYLLISE